MRSYRTSIFVALSLAVSAADAQTPPRENQRSVKQRPAQSQYMGPKDLGIGGPTDPARDHNYYTDTRGPSDKLMPSIFQRLQ